MQSMHMCGVSVNFPESDFISFSPQPICSVGVGKGKFETPPSNRDRSLQLRHHQAAPSHLANHYLYRTRTSKSMRPHQNDYNENIVDSLRPGNY